MEPKVSTTGQPIKIGININKSNPYGLNNVVKDVGELLNGGGLIYAADLNSKYLIGLDKAAEASSLVAKTGGKVALGVSVAYGAYETYKAYEEGGTPAAIKKGTQVAGGIAGSFAGAKLGAAVSAKPALAAGAVGGPVAAGAVLAVGTAVGAIAGYFIGEEAINFVQYLNE